MDEIYKLQEIQGINPFTYKLKKYLFMILIIGILYLVIKLIIVPDILFKIWLIISIVAYSSIVGIAILTIHWFPQYNKDYKKIKDIGEKDKAYIIDTGYTLRGIHPIVAYHYIVIEYKDKNIKIYRIQNNKAYRMLKVLLDTHNYPVQKENLKIPMDIFFYKNKVYADLNSTDFSEIEGYVEAKQIVDKEVI